MLIAVIVTYHPDLAQLRILLQALLPQIGAAVVVDNGSSQDISAWAQAEFAQALHVISLGENKGIAAAQNIGIDWAQARQAAGMILFDQDSRPATDMVAQLWQAYGELQQQGRAVAALGPQICDEHSGASMAFQQRDGWCEKSCYCQAGEVLPVESVIASGCLIPAAALSEIGKMRADFFIDYVDMEWCLRAKQMGFQVFAVCGAKLFHHLGEARHQFGDRKIPVHRPIRYYYMARNRTYLYCHQNLPLAWKVMDAFRLLRKYAFYSLFTAPRRQNWLAMTRGIWDGVCGHLGPIPEKYKPT